MGWNYGYSVYEETVVSVYDLGVLNQELLNALMQPYSGTDMDHGGERGLRSKDGLSADEIVCKVMEPERFAKIVPISDEMPPCVKQNDVGLYYTDGLEGYDYEKWQDAVKNKRDSDVYVLWRKITTTEWDIN